jgi:hypothetical protein
LPVICLTDYFGCEIDKYVDDLCLAAARIDIVLRSSVPDEQAVKSGCQGEAATHVVEFKAGCSKGLPTLLFRRSNLRFNDIFEI